MDYGSRLIPARDKNNRGEGMLIRRLSQWSGIALALAATIWIAQWAAVQLAPGHGPFFLFVVAGFLISTLPNWSGLRR